jgi:peptide deformylase
MSENEKIRAVDLDTLEIIHYPDPRLREVCTPVDDPTDPAVRDLVAKMLNLMFASRGVGLAAPQVGVTVRLFVASPTFSEDDCHVYINPRIIEVDGRQDGDEGCLSFPDIHCKVRRHNIVTIQATGLDGQVFQQRGEELTARIFEHESDHLDGRLLVDRMSRIAKMANRRALTQLEEEFA